MTDEKGGRRETYPSGEKKYYEMDVLFVTEQRNHS